MWRGVKTSTWSPQLLFAGHTHNNLRSIPTSTNNIQSNTNVSSCYLQGGRGIKSKTGAFGILWKPAQIFSPPQLVRKCLTAENIGGFQLVRGSKDWVSPVLWNGSEFLKLRDLNVNTRDRPGTVAENKVGFYVLARGRLCKYFYWCFTSSLGSRAGFNLNYWKIVGSALAASLCLGKEHSELRPGRSGLCLGKCPGRRTQKHG